MGRPRETGLKVDRVKIKDRKSRIGASNEIHENV